MTTRHALARAGLEYMGPDGATVYRSLTTVRSCVACKADTRLLVAFSPRATLPICGSCRGH
jgi:hypothetical protein